MYALEVGEVRSTQCFCEEPPGKWSTGRPGRMWKNNSNVDQKGNWVVRVGGKQNQLRIVSDGRLWY